MSKSQQELVSDILESLKLLDADSPAVEPLLSYLYIANPFLSNLLEQLDVFLNKKRPTEKERQDAGYLLEKIALVAFTSLEGYSDVSSFQSAGPQHDLLITGDTTKWITLCKVLHIETACRSLLLEVKATKNKVDDSQFARLCSIMRENLTETGLGVFFTLKGATGFPKTDTDTRQKKISDARLRQVIFYAHTQKSIVVLDKEDIFALNKNGSLPSILVRKIRDIRDLSGLEIPPVNDLKKIDLPRHLLTLYEDNIL